MPLHYNAHGNKTKITMLRKNYRLWILLSGLIITSSNTFALTSSASDDNFITRQMYVTDEFEVTLRSGTSTSNEILMLLKSGQSVKVLDDDPITQYSLVEADNGKQGYILTRYLVETPSARQRLAELQRGIADQKQENQALKLELTNLQAELNNELSQSETLEMTLNTTEEELEQIRQDSQSTLDIIEINRTLEATVGDLRQQETLLSDENDQLKDRTKINWFMYGGGVSLLAFLVGILVTRIRWKKQDSWGNY
jgi:SH3 domain protein